MHILHVNLHNMQMIMQTKNELKTFFSDKCQVSASRAKRVPIQTYVDFK